MNKVRINQRCGRDVLPTLTDTRYSASQFFKGAGYQFVPFSFTLIGTCPRYGYRVVASLFDSRALSISLFAEEVEAEAAAAP